MGSAISGVSPLLSVNTVRYNTGTPFSTPLTVTVAFSTGNTPRALVAQTCKKPTLSRGKLSAVIDASLDGVTCVGTTGTVANSSPVRG